MNQRLAIPPAVRLLVPMLGSKADNEALGACRAIERKLANAGLDFHDFAGAISTAPQQQASPCSYRAGPPPQYRPSRRPVWTFTEDQTANHKRLARFCRDADNGRLNRSERNFVWRIARQARELTIRQADWLVSITDKLEQEDRACRQA